MRQFSEDASHELQTPLTVLKGEIEVALRSNRTATEYKNTLQSALEEIDRMARLVEGLLLLARADAGVLRIDRQSVELGQLIEDVRSQLAKVALERGLELRVELEGPVFVIGDPILLRQMAQNLVHNGLKFTPAGGTVTVWSGQEEDWAELKISDTGEGLNPEDRSKIFQRFYRSAGARSESGAGAGLGLNIVQSIVQAHQGEIEVISNPGGGSIFTVRLPKQQIS
jgi:signal transduction histidine kinase